MYRFFRQQHFNAPSNSYQNLKIKDTVGNMYVKREYNDLFVTNEGQESSGPCQYVYERINP